MSTFFSITKTKRDAQDDQSNFVRPVLDTEYRV